MNNYSVEKMFKEEIENFVEKKIKDVKCVKEIMDYGGFSLSRTFPDYIKPSYCELHRLKMILQIAINVFNNYEIFCDYPITLLFEKDLNLNQWRSFYKYDVSTDVWTCYVRPSKELLRTILHDYVLCFLTISKNEHSEFVRNNVERSHIKECTFCGSGIEENGEKCVSCRSEIIEMISLLCDKPSTTQVEQRHCEERLSPVTQVPISFSNGANDGPWYDADQQLNVNGSVDRWSCGSCEYLNTYGYLSCETCCKSIKNGKWTCSCRTINSCTDKQCVVCRWSNENLEPVETANKGIDIKQNNIKERDFGVRIEFKHDQWTCGKCGLIQYYEHDICGECHSKRSESGVWSCSKCMLTNKCIDCTCRSGCMFTNKNLLAGNLIPQRKAEIDKAQTTNKEKNTNQNVDAYEVNKWNCEFCNISQLYKNLCCDQCKTARTVCGKWLCEQCELINRCDNITCQSGCCFINKKLPKVNLKSQRNAEIVKEKTTNKKKNKNQNADKNEAKKWNCDNCKLSQLYKNLCCDQCKTARTDCGKWLCGQCELINRCDNSTCQSGCGFINKNLPKVNLKSYNKNTADKKAPTDVGKKTKSKGIDNNGRWLCQSTNCRNSNADKDKFCSLCNLDRHHSLIRGDLVSVMKKKQQVKVWLCFKCHNRNSSEIVNCRGKGCTEMRFEKILCEVCDVTSDGTLDKCAVCHKPL